MRPYYVTTAITYPNAAPHLGHVYEYIATDAIARFKRLDGFDVRFLTGTDEHGLKMAEAAAAEGLPTAELARRNSDVFQRLQERLNISFDRFIRTTDPDHHEASKAIWKRMADAGDIYLDTYSGWYSVRDERFFVESETRVLDDGTRIATETGAPLTWTEEQTYFFRLSAYTDKLLAHYEANPISSARGATQRGGQFRLGRPARPVDLPDVVRLGDTGARSSRPCHVCVGRRADQLFDRRRLSRHRLGVVPPLLAGRSAHDRQGHHSVSRRVLAGVSDVGWDRVAAKGFRTRVPAQPRREDEQVGGQRHRPGGAGGYLRRGSGPLLPVAGGAVRPGRQLQRRGDHHPDQHRPGQRAG
ncbi:methionyl-tRNA synthetase [Mycobacterium xenopi 3993]|nr:methionyl-tRNA synthetase [Mycobacterium xenopi 3993]